MQQRIHTHIPADVLARLEKLCAKTGMPRAEFIRRAVEAALKKAESK